MAALLHKLKAISASAPAAAQRPQTKGYSQYRQNVSISRRHVSFHVIRS